MASNPTPIKIGPFNLGMNNRLPDTELVVQDGRRAKVGMFLRSAVNVDITTEGTLRRRAGARRVLAGESCRALFCGSGGAYFADGTTLYRLGGAADAPFKTAVRNDLAPDATLSFCDSPLGAIYTDGARVELLRGAESRPLSLPGLAAAPVVAVGAGFLPAGAYMLTFTLMDADGRQSASTDPTQVVLAGKGGISISGLPSVFPEGITAVLTYMSEPDGTELYLADVLASATTTHTISSPPTLTARCPTLQHAALPGGSIVRHHLGRFFVARGSTLYFTEPYAQTYNPSSGFIPLPDEITMVEPADKCLFISTREETYTVVGDVGDAELNSVLPYGAVPGTSGQYPDKEGCYWFSARGLCRGDPSGEVVNLQEKAVAVGSALFGASQFRERDGMKQVISSLFGTEPSGAAAHSFMEAEIIRKATTL